MVESDSATVTAGLKLFGYSSDTTQQIFYYFAWPSVKDTDMVFKKGAVVYVHWNKNLCTFPQCRIKEDTLTVCKDTVLKYQ